VSDNDNPTYSGGGRASEHIAAAKGFARAQDKELRERAFRARAAMQGMLAQCRCCYPLTKYETDSEHDERCPAHGTWLSREEVRKRYGDQG
jgi:hypothetical protein